MIRITKPIIPPKILTTKGIDQTNNDCSVFNLNSANYLLGTDIMPDKLNKIYGNDAVQKALKLAQHNKCCYCEQKRDQIEIDVEHFRPKGAVKQSRGKKKIHPGYYWLAYKWENLYLACKSCNTGWKGILFPLVVQKKRSRWHGDINKVSDEKPLFIDPGVEDPRKHIRFRFDTPEPKTKKGLLTIKELGLLADERPFLKEARLEKLKNLQYLCTVMMYSIGEPGNTKLTALSNTAKQHLNDAVHPSAEFSSMAYDFISDYFNKLGVSIDFLN